jgi:hypothetical protein
MRVSFPRVHAATVGVGPTNIAVGFFFASRAFTSLTLFPILTVRCASVAAVLSFHRIAAKDLCFLV